MSTHAKIIIAIIVIMVIAYMVNIDRHMANDVECTANDFGVPVCGPSAQPSR